MSDNDFITRFEAFCWKSVGDCLRHRRHLGFAPSPSVSAIRKVSTIAARNPEILAAIAMLIIAAVTFNAIRRLG